MNEAAGAADATVERPTRPKTEFGNSALLIPIIAGGALAAYNPKLGFAVGGLTLSSAAIFKKGWAWWLVGSVILVLALFFYWKDKESEKSKERA